MELEMVITSRSISQNVKKRSEGFPLKDYIEERAVHIANYIIENNATVRQTAKAFGISKSTVHTVVTKWNDAKKKQYGELNRTETRALSGRYQGVLLL